MKKSTLILILLLSGALTARAQEVIYKLAAPLPGGEPAVSNFTDYAQFLFPFLLSLASVLALVMFTLGAIQYMFSDGGAGNKDGKDKMTSAVLGLLLAAGSVLILETINPNLITLKIDIPQRSGTAPTQNPPPGNGCTTCGGSCYIQDCSFGRTCANIGGGVDGPYACVSGQTCRPECPPAGNSSLTVCSPTQADPNRCVAPDDVVQDQECTPEQRLNFCPPDVPCVIQRVTSGGTTRLLPVCLRQ